MRFDGMHQTILPGKMSLTRIGVRLEAAWRLGFTSLLEIAIRCNGVLYSPKGWSRTFFQLGQLSYIAARPKHNYERHVCCIRCRVIFVFEKIHWHV